MVKYPIGQADFSEIRNGGYLYVDKTMYIHLLVSLGKYFFLSRPRRFGKSLLISTMECYFRAERELFSGLAIDRLEPDEWTEHPVLRLDFTQRGYETPEDLDKVLGQTLDKWEKEYGTPNPDDSPSGRFNSLIGEIYEQTGRQVVILIDEYDSPIVDAHDNPELEAANRRTLHDFYRVMKANEKYLKFVFLTGVGKIDRSMSSAASTILLIYHWIQGMRQSAESLRRNLWIISMRVSRNWANGVNGRSRKHYMSLRCSMTAIISPRTLLTSTIHLV